MKTLLRINASLRVEGSYTYKLSERFTKRWLENNPDGEVIHRCLNHTPIPAITHEGYNSFLESDGRSETVHLSNQLISEIKMADTILIGSPLYNLGVPAGLKNYFDHVVRANETFEVTEQGLQPLLYDKNAVVITSRASLINPQINDDFQTGYIEGVLKFIGVDDVSNICLDGTYCDTEILQPRITKAEKQIDHYFTQPEFPPWTGDFTEKDQIAITELREAQAEAILQGNAAEYSELCTDDIRLMLPGFPAVSGKEAFYTTEANVFKKTRFSVFRKYPLTVECCHDIAFETGVQEVAVEKMDNSEGIYSTSQKYTHIFRRTPKGWRFAVLTSNANE